MQHDLSLHGADARKAHVATLCAMFDHAVETAPDNVALRHFGAALTYRELGCAVAALASGLAARVAPGEVVALVLPNSIDFPVAYFAALKALAAPALLNPNYPAAQLSPLLREASPRVVLCASATKDMVAVAALVMAAANQCLHAADASISPGTVALELRAAIAMLQFNGTTPPQRSGRPVLRVIEGGLSQA